MRAGLWGSRAALRRMRSQRDSGACASGAQGLRKIIGKTVSQGSGCKTRGNLVWGTIEFTAETRRRGGRRGENLKQDRRKRGAFRFYEVLRTRRKNNNVPAAKTAGVTALGSRRGRSIFRASN